MRNVKPAHSKQLGILDAGKRCLTATSPSPSLSRRGDKQRHYVSTRPKTRNPKKVSTKEVDSICRLQLTFHPLIQ